LVIAGIEEIMDDAQVKRVIEAVLFAAGQPVALKRLSEVLEEVETPQLRQLIQTLNDEYMTTGRSFHVQEVAGGYQLVTHSEFAPWIKRALLTRKPDADDKGDEIPFFGDGKVVSRLHFRRVRGIL
jgi:chromosome segregation and condensation protein ScpB